MGKHDLRFRLVTTLIVSLALFLLLCDPSKYDYKVEGDTCTINVYNLDDEYVDEYYAELTWKDGRKTSVNLGYNEEGVYKIKLYGPLETLTVYSNLEEH